MRLSDQVNSLILSGGAGGRATHIRSTLGCVEVGGVDFCNNMSGQLPSNEELQNAMGKLEHLCV